MPTFPSFRSESPPSNTSSPINICPKKKKEHPSDLEEFTERWSYSKKNSLFIYKGYTRTYHKLVVSNPSITKLRWLSPFNRYTRLKAGPITNKILK